MTTLTLPQNFSFLFSEKEFKNKPSLFLEYISTGSEHKKKSFPSQTKVKIENIKKLKSAVFGNKRSDGEDVTSLVEILINKESKVENVKNISTEFNKFCSLFLEILCPRCFNSSQKEESKHTKNIHNSGFINIMIKTSSLYYSNIFDGIIKCFIGYLIDYKTKKINQYQKKVKLYENFFTHILVSIKPENIENTEKTRLYENVNIIHNYMLNKSNEMDYFRIKNKLTPKTIEHIEIFYCNIYYALNYFVNNRTDLFIRHGLEKKTCNYKSNKEYPPNNDTSGWRIKKVSTSIDTYEDLTIPAYPIETDKFPFSNCSMHSSKEMYGCVKGYIGHKYFKNMGGKIHCRYEKSNPTMARDHFFAVSSIPLENWVFTYNMQSPEKFKREIKLALRSLMSCNIPFVADENLKHFSQIFQLIENKFIMLL